ncbi:MAG: hypothetical protein Q7J27_04665 [Syntrophales bacterium]|nr:hypothetical protein [Syntrophales bacterium]
MENNKSPTGNLEKSEDPKSEIPSYKNGKRPAISLHIFIIVTITLAAIAVSIFIGQINHRKTIQLATEQFNKQQLILARSAAVGVENFMVGIETDLLALSNFPVVQRMETAHMKS